MFALTKYTVVGTSIGPTSTAEMQAICAGVPQGAVFTKLQHGSLGANVLKKSGTQNTVLGPSVGALEPTQTLALLLCARSRKAHRC